MTTELELQSKLQATREQQLEHRVALEKCILGACLLEPHCIAEVVDLLGVNSFTGIRRDIWSHITEQFREGLTVDIRTITHRLLPPSGGGQGEVKGNLAYQIASLLSHVNSAANISRHAICLVELTMVDRFLEIYTSCQLDNYSRAMCEDILTALHTDGDKIKVIDDACTWLLRTIPEAEITITLSKFQKAINARVTAITRREKLNNCIMMLEQFTGRGQRPEVRELAEVLIRAINTPSFPVEFTKLVYNLKTALSA